LIKTENHFHQTNTESYIEDSAALDMHSSKLTYMAGSLAHWGISYVDCHRLEAMTGIGLLAHYSLS
jgi:hypothetical protein